MCGGYCASNAGERGEGEVWYMSGAAIGRKYRGDGVGRDYGSIEVGR